MGRYRGYYGANPWRAWWSGLHERRSGLSGRANARWGWLRAPAGRGPALWIQADDRPENVLFGAELAHAIREKRLDLRIILTFEEDYPALIEPRVDGLKGVRYGYGPCDHPRAIRRSLARFKPLRLMTIGMGPRGNLNRLAAAQGIATVVIGAEPDGQALPLELEAIYPLDSGQAARWRARGANAEQLRSAVDFLTLLVTAQVDPNFRRFICGPSEFDLWWLQGVPIADAPSWVQRWREAGLSENGILFIGLEGEGRLSASHPLSAWDRKPVAAGSVFQVDDLKWSPALAAAATAIHLFPCSRHVAWQALAGGKPVTLARAAAAPHCELLDISQAPALVADAAAVMKRWQETLQNPIRARQEGDAMRRFFWDARRQAQACLPELLQRVFDW